MRSSSSPPDAEPAPGASEPNQRIVIGKLRGLHGVAGWLKVASYTEPEDNLFAYSPWLIETAGDWAAAEVADKGRSGKTWRVKLKGLANRDAAARFAHCRIAVDRASLPDLPAGSHYWADLLGKEVATLAGDRLGKVVDIQATGANDVLVVQGETRCLIPFVKGEVVKRVDLEGGVIEVEWRGV